MESRSREQARSHSLKSREPLDMLGALSLSKRQARTTTRSREQARSHILHGYGPGPNRDSTPDRWRIRCTDTTFRGDGRAREERPEPETGSAPRSYSLSMIRSARPYAIASWALR